MIVACTLAETRVSSKVACGWYAIESGFEGGCEGAYCSLVEV